MKSFLLHFKLIRQIRILRIDFMKMRKEVSYLRRISTPFFVISRYLLNFQSNKTLKLKYKSEYEQYLLNRQNLDFSLDFFDINSVYMHDLIDCFDLSSKSLEILEIGSWEGLSSHFFLTNLPKSRITCVDTWEGSPEHKGANSLLPKLDKIEFRFERNISEYQDRVTVKKGTSLAFFSNNSFQCEFDIVYIDGSHHADDVVLDAIFGFNSLAVGGFMIFDDYLWDYFVRESDNPAGAVNLFLILRMGEYELLNVYHQLIIRKTSKSSDLGKW